MRLLAAMLSLCLAAAVWAAGQIPVLNWEERSDWINVKTDVTPAAVGDGVADDTAAIQAALARIVDTDATPTNRHPRVVYFPAGRYRLTKTLELRKITGAWLVGHGRNTVLLWDGQPGGRMLWSAGVHYTRYEGLTLDGRGKAAVGMDHASEVYYETSLRYQHCAFLNCTESGLRVGAGGTVASAEIWFTNCLFQRCGAGATFGSYNDYDNVFDGCEFLDCGIGVNSIRGNFYLHDCHFARSATVDIRQAQPSHASGIHRCTSVGSKRFFDNGQWVHQSVTIEGCRIDAWTAPDGAIVLGRRGPSLIFDNVFTAAPNTDPPIRLVNPKDIQQVVTLSGNVCAGSKAIIDKGANGVVVEIPTGGKRPPVLASAAQRFLRDTAEIPGKVFDARRDFGAVGDNRADDTDAIQRCIDAAKAHGKGAIAYLPSGEYRITRTLRVDGANYYIGSTGFRSRLYWGGAAGGVMVAVRDPQNLILQHLVLDGPDGVTRLRQTSAGGKSSVFYDGLYTSWDMIMGDRNPLEFVELPAGATVRFGQINFLQRFIDCGQATIITQVHWGRAVVEGAKLPKTGFFGYLVHNDACAEYSLSVLDNQDAVIGDFYTESEEHYLLAEGGARKEPGRITINASKISTTKPKAVVIRDYAGRIFIGGGDWWNQTDGNKPVTLEQTGTRPVDLMLVSGAYWQNEPVRHLGLGARFIAAGNTIIGNDPPYQSLPALPPVLPDGALARIAETLDDFRHLGAIDLQLNHGIAPAKK